MIIGRNVIRRMPRRRHPRVLPRAPSKGRKQPFSRPVYSNTKPPKHSTSSAVSTFGNTSNLSRPNKKTRPPAGGANVLDFLATPPSSFIDLPCRRVCLATSLCGVLHREVKTAICTWGLVICIKWLNELIYDARFYFKIIQNEMW